MPGVAITKISVRRSPPGGPAMRENSKNFSHARHVLSYLEALEAGDLQAVANAWDLASNDPELEALFLELDQELASESGEPAKRILELGYTRRPQPSRGASPTRPPRW